MLFSNDGDSFSTLYRFQYGAWMVIVTVLDDHQIHVLRNSVVFYEERYVTGGEA